MKNIIKLIALRITVIIAVAAVIGFTMGACDLLEDTELSGDIAISPSSNVSINMELTAKYSGSESVSYQWKNGSTDVGTNADKFTPTAAGSYTVTVSASGYKSKTSSSVTVTDNTDVFNSVAALKEELGKKPENDPDTPYPRIV